MFPRLRRNLFHLTALASAVLLLAILILWPVSYLRQDAMTYGVSPNRLWRIYSAAGRFSATFSIEPTVTAGLSHTAYQLSVAGAWRSWSYGDRPFTIFRVHVHRLLGCQYCSRPPGGYLPAYYDIDIPYSYFGVLFAIFPALWLLTRQRRRRADHLLEGLCATCSYDLRGHAGIPDAHCPECGTAVSTPVLAT